VARLTRESPRPACYTRVAMVPRGGCWVLVVILSLMLVVVDAPSLHQHRDTGPAWYDEECHALRLAVAWRDPEMLPVVEQVHAIAPVYVAVSATPPGLLRGSFLPTSPRAPPIAS
jgi:hypothetical protein